MPVCIICEQREDETNTVHVQLVDDSDRVVCVWCAQLVIEAIQDRNK